ncbi:flippase-like domain-containing protein [Natronococcus sp. JC468]|uniref:lysylphosphatidylglycerol synthase transmembrane domain-containing protein n=1 Tax=Natronococcus sp. JC468 TaxID=1961921 RepID=UPI001439A635|nr:lysylphosphatidylglycerol synthase transmembrane domain-containing protein [Natronococcus sp. JC468]NKE37886.1 flippase-like domain-containing protein [Natronococcus sp. JC468]
MSGETVVDRSRTVVRSHGVWLTALLSVVVFLGLAVYADVGTLMRTLATVEWETFAIVVGLTTVGYGFRFAKWHYYLYCLEIDVPVDASALTFFSGLMMVVTPGKAGEVWKAWFLRDKRGVPASKTTSVVGAERITDLIALSAMAALGLVFYSHSSLPVVITLGTIVIGIGLLQWRRASLAILGGLESVPVVGQYATDLERFYESAYRLFRLRPLVISTLLSLVAWGLEGLALWVVLDGFGVEASVVVSLFVFGLGSVVGAVSMLPGGLAATEASMIGVLVSFGYSEAVAAAATMIVRVGTLWYAAALGTAVFLTYKGTRLTENE